MQAAVASFRIYPCELTTHYKWTSWQYGLDICSYILKSQNGPLHFACMLMLLFCSCTMLYGVIFWKQNVNMYVLLLFSFNLSSVVRWMLFLSSKENHLNYIKFACDGQIKVESEVPVIANRWNTRQQISKFYLTLNFLQQSKKAKLNLLWS